MNFGPAVEIAVKDTGIGISKENQRKVFDDFYQVKGGLIAKTPGTGLGLSLPGGLLNFMAVLCGWRVMAKEKGVLSNS